MASEIAEEHLIVALVAYNYGFDCSAEEVSVLMKVHNFFCDLS